MLHEPACQCGPDSSAEFKKRLGAWMFLLYGAFYGAFVAINLFAPLWMEKTVLFGMNLAVFYGFSLIVSALVLALVYNYFCTAHENNCARKEQN